MQLYESRLSYFNDKARINYCKSPSVHQHGGRSRPRQNCHSCIFETNENSNLRICIQYLAQHSKTTCQKSAKSMGYRVRPKFEFYRKSLLKERFQHRSTSRYVFQYKKYSDSKSSKSMSSCSFNNQSDSFSSDLNGFKRSQAHYQKNNRIIEVKCRKDKSLFVSSN